MLKPLTVWITKNGKILKEMGIPDHLTCLLGNLYVGQEATIRIGYVTTDWFKTERGVRQGYVLSPWLFIFYAELLFSCSGELQHNRILCPLPSPRVCSNSCPLSQWCHPNISSSVIPFSSCLQSFPASGSFPMSQLFASGGQMTGASASASILPMNIQSWFPLALTGTMQSTSCEMPDWMNPKL